VRRILGSLLILLLLAGDGALVQGLGWASMLASRTAALGWSRAVDSTFSGKAPCHLCLASKALREQPTPAAPVSDIKLLKTVAVMPTSLPLMPASMTSMCLPPTTVDGLPAGFVRTPEPPPPRHG